MSSDQPLKPTNIEKMRPDRWYHPLSAVVMIVFDFGGTIGDLEGLSFTIILPFVILGIFLLVACTVAWIQKRCELDTPRVAWLKGVIAGVLCAIPFPIFGTAFGTFLLGSHFFNKKLKS
jgi:hypothetical protein